MRAIEFAAPALENLAGVKMEKPKISSVLRTSVPKPTAAERLSPRA
jgi:hypothetical protein